MSFNEEMGIVPEQLVELADKHPIIGDQLNIALEKAAEVLDCSLPITMQLLEEQEPTNLYEKAIQLFQSLTRQSLKIEETSIKRRDSYFRSCPHDFFVLVLTASIILGERNDLNQFVLHGSPKTLIRNAQYLLDNDILPKSCPNQLILPIDKIKLEINPNRTTKPLQCQKVRDTNKRVLQLENIDVERPESMKYLSRFIGRHTTEEINKILIRLKAEFPSGSWKHHPNLIAEYNTAFANATKVDEITESRKWRSSNVEICLMSLEKVKRNAEKLKLQYPLKWKEGQLLNALNLRDETLEGNIYIINACRFAEHEWNNRIISQSTRQLSKNIFKLILYLSQEGIESLSKRGITQESIQRDIENENLHPEIITMMKEHQVGLYDPESLQKTRTQPTSLIVRKPRNSKDDYDNPFGNGGW